MLLLSTTVNYIRTRFADLRAREDGVTAVEYALMVAIIALLMVAGFFLLFDNVQDRVQRHGRLCRRTRAQPATCAAQP